MKTQLRKVYELTCATLLLKTEQVAFKVAAVYFLWLSLLCSHSLNFILRIHLYKVCLFKHNTIVRVQMCLPFFEALSALSRYLRSFLFSLNAILYSKYSNTVVNIYSQTVPFHLYSLETMIHISKRSIVCSYLVQFSY